MKLIENECSNCGAKLEKIDSKNLKCPFCGTTFFITDTNSQLKVQKTPVKNTNKAGVGLLILIVSLITLLPMILFLATSEDNNDISNPNINANYNNNKEITETFKAFCESVFNKPYAEITKDDFSGITYLYVRGNYEHTEIVCTLNGDEHRFVYEGGQNQIVSNSYKFTNLEELNTNSNINPGYIDGLKKLTTITCNNDINTLSSVIPYPENITSLSNVCCRDTAEALNIFTNLTVLNMNIFQDATDISAINNLDKLEVLYLDSNDDFKIFDFLNNMHNLKELHLDSEGLRNIDFVKNMNNLEILDVENSSITSLEPLKGNTTIKTLLLDNCSDIKDYEIINTLTNLEGLSVPGEYIYDKIDWANLSQLKSLYIDSFLDSNFVRDAYKLENLTELKLGWCGQELDDLSKLKNLKSLSMEYINTDLFFLEGMTGLENIYIANNISYLYGGENVFLLPNIKNITIFDARLYIDVNKDFHNDSIEKIDIKYCNFDSINYNTYDYLDMNGDDIIKLIYGFKNAKEIYLRGMDIDSIDFVNSKPNLEILDITNNFVSDLSPLTNCNNLSYVRCGDNSYTTIPELKESVFIDERGEENHSYK